MTFSRCITGKMGLEQFYALIMDLSIFFVFFLTSFFSFSGHSPYREENNKTKRRKKEKEEGEEDVAIESLLHFSLCPSLSVHGCIFAYHHHPHLHWYTREEGEEVIIISILAIQLILWIVSEE